MKKMGMILLVLSVFLSCTSNSIYEKPKDLIPKDSMVLLLKDLYLATAAKNIKNKNLERRFSYIPLVYEKYKIDSARFHRSNIFYTSRIDIYEPLLNEILKALEDERGLFAQQKKVKDSLQQDSIKKARKENFKNDVNLKLDAEAKKKKELKISGQKN